MKGPAEFEFLGVEQKLTNDADWNNIAWPKLCLYNLHYFDYLSSTDASERVDWHRDLIRRWVRDNPPAYRNGWEPYPVSRRIVNWIKWALGAADLDRPATHSLAVQARSLRRRLEYRLLGNHLWANAKALVFAGTFFEGTEADTWRAKGLSLIRREFEEQILDDGGHFERSPMYHASMLEDVLELTQLHLLHPGVFDHREVQTWRMAIQRMFRWLRVMTHPDGEIAFFNDATFGIAPTYQNLAQYARMLDIPIGDAPMQDMEVLESSGYVRLESGPAALIMDVGQIGPDYQPGHAHADTLSFELSLNGQRVFVNGGTSTYEVNDERLRQRGTASHNTVVVDGEDSSEVWASFRVARRARPFNVHWERDGDELVVGGSHDGYRRLPGRVVHRREVRLGANKLEIEDYLEGSPERAVAMIHLHPEITVHFVEGQRAVLRGSGLEISVSVHGARKIEVLEDAWHPEFGKSLPSTALSLPFAGHSIKSIFVWK